MSVLRFLLFLGIIVFLVFPALAWAQPWPFVRCANDKNPDPCTLCNLFETGQRILEFLVFYIAVPAATIGIVIGGTLLLIAGGNEALVGKGRNAIKFAVAGLMVILISFIVINTVINAIAIPYGETGPGGRTSAFPWPWNRISCSI